MKKELLKLLLDIDDDSKHDTTTFYKIGESYLIRTVTMIYTGRIKAINDTQLLLEDAAWIPETERWADCVRDCTFKEVEPYTNDVILHLGAILDSTKINTLPRAQK